MAIPEGKGQRLKILSSGLIMPRGLLYVIVCILPYCQRVILLPSFSHNSLTAAVKAAAIAVSHDLGPLGIAESANQLSSRSFIKRISSGLLRLAYPFVKESMVAPLPK